MTKYPFVGYAPLAPLAVCMALGIALGDQWALPLRWLWLWLALTALLTVLATRRPRVQSALIGLCCVALGAALVTHQRLSLEAAQWPSAPVEVEAMVVSELAEKPRSVAVDVVLAKSGWRLKCYVAKDERSRGLAVGDGLRMRVRPNRGGRWRRYMEVHGITGQTYVAPTDWERCRPAPADYEWTQRLRVRFLAYRHQLLERYRRSATSAEAYGVVAAMALGDKSALDAAVKDVYNVTGASHVLALSGLHLGIVYGLLSLVPLGRRLRVPARLAALLGVWAFALLVGLPTSVVRAAFMITVYGLLSLLRRQGLSLNVLALTAIALLCCNAYSLFDVGFQMSFMAVLGILLGVPVLERFVSRPYLQRHRLLRWLWSLGAVSLSAQLGVGPLLAYYFGRFSTYFLLTNFVAVPLAVAVLYLSLGALLLPRLGAVLFWVVTQLNAALGALSRLPLASVDGLHPSALQVALLYTATAALLLAVARLGRGGCRRGYM